jgi:hypothetical protein
MAFSTSNVAIPIPSAEGSSLLATLATQMFENYNKEMGDAIINKNFVLAYLKSKAEREEVGGLDFAEPVLKGANSNFAFRDKFAVIPSNYQTPTDALRFAPAVLTGVIPINKVHELQNQGKSQIMNFLDTLQKQAVSTVSNLVSAAMWNSSPVTDIDPESLLSLISTTPTTGTIGGVSRVSNTWARNKVYDTTVSSVGSAAGIAALFAFYARLGGAANDTPDFAVTTTTIYGNILGFYAGTNRRLTQDATMTKIGVKSMELMPGCELGYDGDAGLAGDGSAAACPASSLYYLNSKHLFYKILKGGNTKFEAFTVKDNSINKTSVFYHIYNMTTNLPGSLGVMSAITG